MELKKFLYNGKHRIVFVLEETDSSIKGIDLSALTETEKCNFLNDITEHGEDDKKTIDTYSKKGFRHFKKSLLEDDYELE